MSVGVMKDYKLKLRNLRASRTLGWSKKKMKEGPGKTKSFSLFIYLFFFCLPIVYSSAFDGRACAIHLFVATGSLMSLQSFCNYKQ
jgi:hypothetical protein